MHENQAPSPYSRYLVFVADDDAGILEVIQALLTIKGYSVDTAIDSLTLTNLIKSKKPDIILLDLQFGLSDGAEICAALKESIDTRDIPVLMISANENLVEIAGSCGADDYLSKPFEIDSLLERIKTLVKRW